MTKSKSRNPLIFLSVLCVIAGIILGIYYFLGGAKTAVVVEWDTASEVNTAGFNLYRSTLPEGPFLKINDELIPSSSDPFVGSNYSYNDEDVIPGQTYYYQLEDIENNGMTTIHGPIEVSAKQGNTYMVILAGLLLTLGASILVYSFLDAPKGDHS